MVDGDHGANLDWCDGEDYYPLPLTEFQRTKAVPKTQVDEHHSIKSAGHGSRTTL